MDAFQTYWFSLICIAIGALGLGWGFGYLWAWRSAWQNGFNRASEIWSGVMDAADDDDSEFIGTKLGTVEHLN